MVRVPSTMPDLGMPAPEFSLPEPGAGVVSLSDFDGSPGLVVAFICNHCPFVKHLRTGLAEFGRDCVAAGISMVAINSNDVASHPADRPDMMIAEKAAAGWSFPYLFDETQDVAHAYRAACTPDFYLFDGARRLFYRGEFDASRPGNGVPVTGTALQAAVDTLLQGGPPPAEQRPSAGCNIKWLPGNEPVWFGGN